MEEEDTLMVKAIVLVALGNNVEIIVQNLFHIKRLIILHLEDMIQVIIGIGKKELIQEFIEILVLLMQ